MLRFKYWPITVFVLAVASIACSEPPFHQELKEAATTYKSWGRVDEVARLSPIDCRSPRASSPNISASDDAATHGQKLYSLFAKERTIYLDRKRPNSPIGQAIVKQAWSSDIVGGEEAENAKKFAPYPTFRQGSMVVVTPAGDPKTGGRDREDHFFPYVVKDRKVFKAVKQADLFIMLKLDPKTPGTDEGWVYGTVSPDGKTVSSAGRVASCMKCHSDAKHDRLFGLDPP